MILVSIKDKSNKQRPGSLYILLEKICGVVWYHTNRPCYLFEYQSPLSSVEENVNAAWREREMFHGTDYLFHFQTTIPFVIEGLSSQEQHIVYSVYGALIIF